MMWFSVIYCYSSGKPPALWETGITKYFKLQIRRLRPTEVKSSFKVKQLVSRQTRIRVQASWLGHLKEFLILPFPVHNSGMSPILRYYAACLASQKQPTYTSLRRQGRIWGYGGQRSNSTGYSLLLSPRCGRHPDEGNHSEESRGGLVGEMESRGKGEVSRSGQTLKMNAYTPSFLPRREVWQMKMVCFAVRGMRSMSSVLMSLQVHTRNQQTMSCFKV